MLFFETTCIERRDPTDSFQSYSGVEEALVHTVSRPRRWIRQFDHSRELLVTMDKKMKFLDIGKITITTLNTVIIRKRKFDE
jgi:hypothetical protein